MQKNSQGFNLHPTDKNNLNRIFVPRINKDKGTRQQQQQQKLKEEHQQEDEGEIHFLLL